MAQDEKTIIRSRFQPTLRIDRLEVEDLFTGTSDKLDATKKGKEGGHQEQNNLGTDFPFLTINNYVFDQDEILYFKIDATDFIPTVTFTFRLAKSDVFRSQGYPKDGDILSVFIRAKNNAFKPIRNDYVIIGVNSLPGGVENSGGTTTLIGELFIPRFKDQIIKSYKGTSFDVLQKIAQELGLGFATNETSTNDSQVWLCGNDRWEDYINHIVDYCWKDENSFYKCYIDIYYHLNFINVNNQLEGDGQLAAGILDNVLFKDFYLNDKGSESNSQQPVGKFLSNMENYQGTNMFIRNYTTKNNSTEINQDLGYKYSVQFFDMKSLDYWTIYIDPKTSDGAERKKIILKGRTFPKKEDQKNADGTSPSENEHWKTQNRYVWRGIQSTNVHDKYLIAEANNKRNRAELSKMFLEVHVTRWNPNIYMGEKVPLLLIAQADKMKAQLDAQGEDKKLIDQTAGEPAVLDQFYSGYYMVNGVSITYAADGAQYSTSQSSDGSEASPQFFETFTMTRREWPTPLG